MKEFSVFVITAAACVFFLTGCGVASDSTSSVEPDTPHTESTAQPTATPIITPAPDAESSEAVEKSLFDPCVGRLHRVCGGDDGYRLYSFSDGCPAPGCGCQRSGYG